MLKLGQTLEKRSAGRARILSCIDRGYPTVARADGRFCIWRTGCFGQILQFASCADMFRKESRALFTGGLNARADAEPVSNCAHVRQHQREEGSNASLAQVQR